VKPTSSSPRPTRHPRRTPERVPEPPPAPPRPTGKRRKTTAQLIGDWLKWFTLMILVVGAFVFLARLISTNNREMKLESERSERLSKEQRDLRQERFDEQMRRARGY
jgi:hypothetical protein